MADKIILTKKDSFSFGKITDNFFKEGYVLFIPKDAELVNEGIEDLINHFPEIFKNGKYLKKFKNPSKLLGELTEIMEQLKNDKKPSTKRH